MSDVEKIEDLFKMFGLYQASTDESYIRFDNTGFRYPAEWDSSTDKQRFILVLSSFIEKEKEKAKLQTKMKMLRKQFKIIEKVWGKANAVLLQQIMEQEESNETN